MDTNIEEITTTIQIAKAIEEDIREYESIDVEAAYLINKRRLQQWKIRQSFTYYMSGIAAVLLLPFIISTGILSYLYWEQFNKVGKISYMEASSAPGIVTKVKLPDNSLVWLNAGSTLRYPSRFIEKERVVHLHGEGYFQVRSDKKHPFYVAINNDIRVKAYGTKFNVNAYDEDLFVETVLESGNVDLIIATRTILLKPNDQAIYNKSEKKVSIRPVNIEEETAWKDGKLIFRNVSLDEVLKQLSRRYNLDIVLHKESKKDYKFRATFKTENITQIMNYLRLAAPIQWSFVDTEQQSDYTYPKQKIEVWLK